MKSPITTAYVALFGLLLICGCGGKQKASTNIETRPLEENKAFEIIQEVLAERGYTWDVNTPVQVANKKPFPCDFKIKDHPIAIEYVNDQDRTVMGEIPPAAAGSRLHVLAASVHNSEPNAPFEKVYVFFIDDRKFVYHYNPTSDVRADITFPEIDARLRRDLADFISWYETSTVKR